VEHWRSLVRYRCQPLTTKCKMCEGGIRFLLTGQGCVGMMPNDKCLDFKPHGLMLISDEKQTGCPFCDDHPWEEAGICGSCYGVIMGCTTMGILAVWYEVEM